MSANSAFTLARSASPRAGAVFAAAAALSFSPSTLTTITTTSPKSKFPPNHRPNKLELESCLFHAHVRAHRRRLQQAALGHGLPSSIAQRTSRATGCSVPRDISLLSTPSPTTTLAPSPSPPPLCAAPAGSPFTTTTNTTLPTESTDRPRFPHRRSRVGPFRGVGLGLQLDVLEEDAIVTPSHVFPATLRRTPGAPVWAMAEDRAAVSPGSYFHLPSQLLQSPAQPAPAVHGATVGLGIAGVDLEEDGRIERRAPDAS